MASCAGRTCSSRSSTTARTCPTSAVPCRLVVPRLYFWKSAEWIRALDSWRSMPRLLEVNGYRLRADPWREERYSDQETRAMQRMRAERPAARPPRTEVAMAKSWFITGASGGLGRKLAEVALSEGDTVTAAIRRPEVLRDLADAHGDRLILEALDVTSSQDVARVIAACVARGRVDVVVNNAGGGLVGATEEMTDADVQQDSALTCSPRSRSRVPS